MSKIRPWKKLGSSVAFQKYSRVLESVDFALPNGVETDFIIDTRGPAVCIVGFTQADEVILVKQFRPGPMKILTELPGGFVDEDATALESARNELLEETGYEGDMEFVGTCLDDAYSTMVRHCYVAKNCRQISEPVSTDTESTEVVLVSLEKFRELLRKGEMTDIEVGYLGLDYLGLL